jgi:ribonuclease G
MASPRPRIQHYRDLLPLFEASRIENDIEEGLGRKVWLRSGGYLIIDQGEALTAIDVNTGRYTGGKGRSLEDTILKTNLEAVREIVHQLRFRNIGGLIILDLIDMEVGANREKVYKALVDALREDKSKVNLLKISELGLVEMTRKRTRESLTQQLCEPCPACEGKGYLQSARTVAQKIFRDLPRAAGHMRGATLRLRVHPQVATLLRGESAEGLARIAERIGRELEVDEQPGFHPEQVELVSAGERVAALSLRLPPEPDASWRPEVDEPVAEDLDDAPEDEPELEAEPMAASDEVAVSAEAVVSEEVPALDEEPADPDRRAAGS